MIRKKLIKKGLFGLEFSKRQNVLIPISEITTPTHMKGPVKQPIVSSVDNPTMFKNSSSIKYDINRNLQNNSNVDNSWTEVPKHKEKPVLNLDTVAKFVLDHEGGFVDDPDDPGGATNKGVTLDTYRKYFGKDKTIDDLKNISDEEWNVIFRDYADKSGYNKIYNKKIASALVDNKWHGGLQNVLKRSGYSGDLFLDIPYINMDPNQENVLKTLIDSRDNRFGALIKQNPKLGKYEKGWKNRTRELGELLNSYE